MSAFDLGGRICRVTLIRRASGGVLRSRLWLPHGLQLGQAGSPRVLRRREMPWYLSRGNLCYPSSDSQSSIGCCTWLRSLFDICMSQIAPHLVIRHDGLDGVLTCGGSSTVATGAACKVRVAGL